MKNFKFYLMAALVAATTCTGFTSCSDDDDAESTVNPATRVVAETKKYDTAILLCTFGSTYNESLDVYNEIIADFRKQFPQTDIYMSFTSRTCIGRAEASTGEARYKLDQWLKAIGDAGYTRVAVQSLHVIPGEEYLSLMNTDIKKNFMIDWYPHIDVLKGANLLSTDDDTDEVAQVLYNHYKDKLAEKKNIVLLMGHGNPDVNYNANTKYSEVQTALHTLATNKNIFVGTVDYGEMLFWPKEEEEKAVDRIPVVPAAQMIADYPGCIYSQVMKYCQDNNLEPNEVNVYLAPFMSIAGDHAHNDLWGIEAIAENKGLDKVELNTNEYSWRERLEKAGFKVDRTFEAHPVGQADADHGIKDGCGIKALGSYPERVLGLGDIGGEFAKRAKALGARVIGVRRTGTDKPDFVDELIHTDKLDEYLPQADCVAITLPGTTATKGMFDAERMAKMKDGAILLNVGRGMIVDTDALCAALENGKLAGAGVDVTDPEPLPADHPLWKMENAVITPHISGGYHLQETHDRIVRIMAENLKRFLAGEPLRNVVDFSTGYRKL